MQSPNKHKKLSCLVTGGNGFLGSYILEDLIRAGHDAHILTRQKSSMVRIEHIISKVTSQSFYEDTDLDAFFKSAKIDTVIHCATSYGRKEVPPLDIIEANLVLPLRLLHTGSLNGLKTFINTDTMLDKRISEYSLSKRQFREWFLLYANRLRCINVALEHFYGPKDDATKFISWVIDQIVRGKSEVPMTLGEQRRDFIHIKDVCSAFSVILNSLESLPLGFSHFEVGTGQTTSIREIVNLISNKFGKHQTKFKFGALDYREHEVMQSSVDIHKLLELGWKPEILLDFGVSEMVAIEKELLR